MNQDQTNTNNLLDTTDCLEAVGVFRGWKNFLFVIIICCLLLLQVSFWLVDTGCVKAEDKSKAVETTLPVIKPPVIIEPPPVITPPAANELVVPLEEKLTGQPAETLNKIEKAAKQVAKAPNQPTEAAPQVPGIPYGEPQQPQQQKTGLPRLSIKIEHLTWLVRFSDFVLILAAILYCLTMLFSLKISLLGRLGGINHICRAFFLSLSFLVLLLPWQRFFAGVVVGAMYTPGELLSSCAAADDRGIFGATLYYLRFTGFWLLVVLLLIFSQLRSNRWARTVLRRLEVI